MPRPRNVSATSTLAARQAGSSAAASAAPRPSAAATANAAGRTASSPGGATVRKFSAMVVATSGSSARPISTPAGRPRATPARPSSWLSLSSSHQTARRRTPTARSTPSCQVRSAKHIDRREKAMMKAAPSATRLTPCSSTCIERRTVRRSALRCATASTRSPSGRMAWMRRATAAVSASASVTMSRRLIRPGLVNTASAACTSIRTRVPPKARPMPCGSTRPRTVNACRPRAVSSSSWSSRRRP